MPTFKLKLRDTRAETIIKLSITKDMWNNNNIKLQLKITKICKKENMFEYLGTF